MSVSFKQKIFTLLLFMPQLLITFLLLLGLMIGMVQSLGIIPSLGLTEPTLSYYQELFSQDQFLNSLWFSLSIALRSSILSILIGLIICYLWLNQKKYSRFMQGIIRIPIIIPHIIVALFVLQLFSQTGIIARLLYILGFENARQMMSQFVYHPNGWGVVLGYIWKEVPFVIFYCYPMIASISQNLGEAATTLGARPWQAYVRITLPLAKKSIFAAFFIIFMFSFGAYELPTLLGPTLPRSLPLAAYQAYSHPDLLQRPYALAYNGIILLIGLIAALVIVLVLKAPSLSTLSKGVKNNQ